MDAGMKEKAEEAFQNVFKFDKEDWDNYIQIGAVYLKEGDRDRAFSYFAKAFSKEQDAGSVLKLLDCLLEIQR